MKGGTAYHTDAGMCGDYDSVIGMQKEGAVGRFLGRLPRERMQPAAGEATLCGTYLETDDATGLAAKIAPIRLGGMLQPQWPVLSSFPLQACRPSAAAQFLPFTSDVRRL